MRLLVVNVFGGPTHRQRIWYRLAELTGWDVHLVVGSRWVDDYGNVVEARQSEEPLVTVHPLPVGLSGNIPLHYWKGRVAALTKRLAPDLVYMYSEPYALATIQLALAMPKKMTFGFHSAQNIVKRYPLPFRLGQKFVLQRSAFATSVSDEVTAGLREKGFTGPIGSHTFGLPEQWFGDLSSTAARAGLRVAFVGRLSDEKGLRTLLTAVEAAGDAIEELRVFGEGKERDAYEKLVAASPGLRGRVHFEGFLAPDEVSHAYDWADALVVPSETTPAWKEQFGRVVIEAGARGCYPIVSSSGELPHLVGRLGFGVVTPERDATAWAASLRDASVQLGELRPRRVDRSGRVRELFSERAVAGELATFFADVVKSRRPGARRHG